MTTLVEETDLEDIVTTLARDRTFSKNSVALSLDNYGTNADLNPDWIYYLARDIEDNRKALNAALEEWFNVNPLRLYKALPRGTLRENTNRPALPHSVYFVLIGLLHSNPESYKGEEGYIQLAKDVRQKTGTAANLAQIWSGARAYRSNLQWPGIIDLPLKVFDAIDALIKASPKSYKGEEGYIQLAKDVRQETGTAANLAHIWSGSRQYRKELQWPGIINLPLEVFDTIDKLIQDDKSKYQGEEGYIQLARDIRQKTGTAANLATIWSGSRQYRKELQWTGVIKMPLDVYLATRVSNPAVTNTNR